ISERLDILEQEMRKHLMLGAMERPDYALWSAGARIIPSVTSATYVVPSQTWRMPWSTRPIIERKPPELALTPEVYPGYCWAMKGRKGSLGITLAGEIRPSAVTIDYPAKGVTFHRTTAPRNIEVWGFLPKKVKGIQQEGDRTVTGLHLHLKTDLPLHPEHYYTRFVLLGNFTYDADGGPPAQTFPLHDARLLLGRMLILFLDNWGNEACTCIYRVRIHGQPAGQLVSIRRLALGSMVHRADKICRALRCVITQGPHITRIQ
ncbi:hypothetical protein LXA43DRAFT_904677, partial [Ganoderma leucocontextum]